MKRFILSILLAVGLVTLTAAQNPAAAQILAAPQNQAGPQTPTAAQTPAAAQAPAAAQTQTRDTTRPASKRPATERAVHQLKTLEKRLQLSQDQVLQLQVILIHKDIAMDSIRNNTSGDRRTDNRSRHSVQQDADTKINAMLTQQQRTLYQQWKQEQHEKALQRKQPGAQ
jgi:hypothetical protein